MCECNFKAKNNNFRRSFWCPINNKCRNFKAFFSARNVGGNVCGYDKLTNQRIPISMTKKEYQWITFLYTFTE